MRVCVQVAYVSSGQSEVAVQFCYLAMSAIVHEFRFTNQTVDVYPIVSDQLGHVTDDEIVKLLRDEIGVRYASKIGVSISANPSVAYRPPLSVDWLPVVFLSILFFCVSLHV